MRPRAGQRQRVAVHVGCGSILGEIARDLEHPEIVRIRGMPGKATKEVFGA